MILFYLLIMIYNMYLLISIVILIIIAMILLWNHSKIAETFSANFCAPPYVSNGLGCHSVCPSNLKVGSNVSCQEILTDYQIKLDHNQKCPINTAQSPDGNYCFNNMKLTKCPTGYSPMFSNVVGMHAIGCAQNCPKGCRMTKTTINQVVYPTCQC